MVWLQETNIQPHKLGWILMSGWLGPVTRWTGVDVVIVAGEAWLPEAGVRGGLRNNVMMLGCLGILVACRY